VSGVDWAQIAAQTFGHSHWETPKAIIREVMQPNARVAVKGCHSSSKTYSIADTIILSLLAGGDVLTTAPTGSQVSGVLWPTIHRALADCKLPTPEWTKNQTEIILPDRHFAIGRSTDQGVRLQGYHAQPGSFLTIVVDEAPGVISEVMGAIEGMAAGGDVRVVILGNPIVPSGDFYEAFQGERSIWTRYTIGAFTSPNFQKPDGSFLTLDELLAMDPVKGGPLDQNVRDYLITRRYVYDRYWAWGEQHPWWAGRILGEFPGQAIGSLLPLDWLNRAARTPALYVKGRPITAGVDVAGEGEDETVVTLIQGDGVLAEAVFPQPDPRGEVAAYLLKWISRGLAVVNYDKAGLGYYFGLHLRDVLPAGVAVRGVNVGERPIADPNELDPETGKPIDQGTLYENLKAQLYWHLRERFREGRVVGLADQTLVNQLASIQYGATKNGKTTIVSKKDMRKKGLSSPDRAESLMLAFAPPLPDDPRDQLWGKSMTEVVGTGVLSGVPDREGGRSDAGDTNGWASLYGRTIGETQEW
jgi:phage terminase large subunit